MKKVVRYMTTGVMASAMGLAVAGCKSGGTSSSDQDNMSSGNGNSNCNTSMPQKNIIQTATGPGMSQVSTLVTAIKAADLVDTLEGPGPFTVFAPTNAAFNKLPKGELANLLKPENKEKLKSILLYHVHTGEAIKAQDAKTMELSTAEGQPLNIKVEDGKVMVNGAKVVKANIECSNGVIHWVNKVLIPPQM